MRRIATQCFELELFPKHLGYESNSDNTHAPYG